MLSILILFSSLALAQAGEWSETFVRYAGSGPVTKKEPPYLANDDSRTYLHIKYTPGKLSGVYIYAHGNGGDADISEYHRSSVTEAGYAFISWESVTPIIDPYEDSLACMSDHRLVMEWVVANAAKYSLDLSNIVMGGRSRGSTCSWPLAHAHEDSYTVTGIYMYGALPCESCFEPSNPTNFNSYVTAQSPPLLFVYGPECPKPITQDCIPCPHPNDIHNPKNGQRVVEKYQELGLGPLVNLKDGEENAGIRNILYYFPSFLDGLRNNSMQALIFEESATPCGGGGGEQDACKKAMESAGCLNGKDCEECAANNQVDLGKAGCDQQSVKRGCTEAAETTNATDAAEAAGGDDSGSTSTKKTL